MQKMNQSIDNLNRPYGNGVSKQSLHLNFYQEDDKNFS
jgi:hypothetical protein